jgi:putrescine transport system substrate-binding protein
VARRFVSRMKTVCAALALSGIAWYTTPAAHADEQVVNVYNWGNSIGKDTLANFEKATGIKVVYQEFDSNDTLQAKLLSGSSGYDVVVPSDMYWARQLRAGIFQKIDRSKIPNYAHLDPEIMKIVAQDDPGNQYGVPWSWGTDVRTEAQELRHFHAGLSARRLRHGAVLSEERPQHQQSRRL